MSDDEFPPIQPKRRFTIKARVTMTGRGQPMPYDLDDNDLYYARALARSCAQAHVKKLRCAD